MRITSNAVLFSPIGPQIGILGTSAMKEDMVQERHANRQNVKAVCFKCSFVRSS